ncbi:MAG: SPOR domain-containing protein [Thalassobaculaceae bacterium]|nr:SPOR domain-containing protein [Thalassobaculaceae bacterium]
MSQDGDGLQADAYDRPGPPPELRDPPRRSRALGAFLATFALAAFAGVVWYAYDRGLQAGSEATAPLIQADPSPIKVRPEQPGGLDVPNQDKLVYGALRPGQEDGATVERLLPPPEKPVEPPQPEPVAAPAAGVSETAQPAEDRGAPTGTASAANGSTTVPIPARTPQPVTAPTQSAAAAIPPPGTAVPVPPPPAPQPVPQPAADDIPPAQAPAPQTAAATPPPPPPVPEPKPEAVPAPQPAPAAVPAPSPPPVVSAPAGRFRIQLGAFRDEAAARSEWNRLTKRYPEALSGLQLRIQTVDLGANKGVFHRIQGGMLTEDEAEQACATLKSRNQPCLLVRP